MNLSLCPFATFPFLKEKHFFLVVAVGGNCSVRMLIIGFGRWTKGLPLMEICQRMISSLGHVCTCLKLHSRTKPCVQIHILNITRKKCYLHQKLHHIITQANHGKQLSRADTDAVNEEEGRTSTQAREGTQERRSLTPFCYLFSAVSANLCSCSMASQGFRRSSPGLPLVMSKKNGGY